MVKFVKFNILLMITVSTYSMPKEILLDTDLRLTIEKSLKKMKEEP